MAEEKNKKKLFSINNDLFTVIKEAEFDNLTFDSSKPALVLFGAERCKVCKELQPVLEEILPDYASKMNSYFVDVDENKELMKRFRLRGIPTVLLFNYGEVRERTAGLRSKEELIELIDKALA